MFIKWSVIICRKRCIFNVDFFFLCTSSYFITFLKLFSFDLQVRDKARCSTFSSAIEIKGQRKAVAWVSQSQIMCLIRVFYANAEPCPLSLAFHCWRSWCANQRGHKSNIDYLDKRDLNQNVVLRIQNTKEWLKSSKEYHYKSTHDGRYKSHGCVWL